MTRDQFRKAAGISDALADRWYPSIISAMNEFKITTPQRQAAFLAQVGHESGGFSRIAESFNYSVSGLSIFSKYLTPAQRNELGRQTREKTVPKERQIKIANLVYGNRYGNGADEGWKFRGRGLIQITFKNNYADCGKGLGVDLISKPEMLEWEEYAARSAGWYWDSRKLNAFADEGEFTKIIKAINGGLNGQEDRIKRRKLAESVLLPTK